MDCWLVVTSISGKAGEARELGGVTGLARELVVVSVKGEPITEIIKGVVVFVVEGMAVVVVAERL